MRVCDVTEINPCDESPCKNGGHCEHTGPGQYECQCPEGYTGTNCEEEEGASGGSGGSGGW